MNRYKNVVSSGDEIIGSIPNHWGVKPLKYIAELSDKKNNDDIERRMLSVSQYLGIVEKEYENEDQRRSEEESANYWVVEDQNLVANTMWLNYRGIGVSRGVEGYVSPAYRVYWLDTEIVEPRFIHYLMRSDLYVGIYTKHLKGIRPNSLQVSTYDFQHINVVIPPLEEQRLILRYLDKKTEQIDGLIEKIQKKVELLKEQRTSLINQCVTKGLDPNVEMKNSWVVWIGEIPKHWELSRIKYLSSMISKGTTPSTIGEDLDDKGEIRFLKSENIVDGQVVSEPEFYISNETDELIKRSRLEEGDVLVVIAGAMVGKTAVMATEFLPANTNQAVSFIRPISNWYSSLIYFWMSSKYVKMTINQTAVVSAQPNLSMENLGNLRILVPPKDEQVEIINFIEEKSGKIGMLITKETERLNLLKEHRQSLISSAVTGKIRVTEDMI